MLLYFLHNILVRKFLLIPPLLMITVSHWVNKVLIYFIEKHDIHLICLPLTFTKFGTGHI